MFERFRKKKEKSPRDETLDAIVKAVGHNFGGDFTVYVGSESIGPGVGMSPEDSKKFREATRRAIRELYPDMKP